MRTLRRSGLLALGLTLAAAVAQAAGVTPSPGVYKWVDRHGVVHYDDTTTTAERMTREYLDKRNLPDEPEWAGVIPGEFVAEVEQRCSLSRERLAGYRSASALYGRDPSGNTYPLSRTQAKLMIAESEREVAYWCRDQAVRKIYAERQAAARKTDAATR